MLTDHYQKVKSWIREHRNDLFVAAVIFYASLASFGLGRLSALWPEKQPLRIIEKTESVPYATSSPQSSRSSGASVAAPLSQKGKYVVSKSGKYYHYPWCPGALRIKEENKIWFETRKEAEALGYKPAGNCEGL